MKKLFVLVALFTTLYATDATAQQQGGGDPVVMMQRMKERIKPQLLEKTKLTEAQADKVVEINFENRQQMRGFRDLSEDDRKKKTGELKTATDKKYKDIPLTDDQVKNVNDFFEEMRKNTPQRNGGGNN